MTTWSVRAVTTGTGASTLLGLIGYSFADALPGRPNTVAVTTLSALAGLLLTRGAASDGGTASIEATARGRATPSRAGQKDPRVAELVDQLRDETATNRRLIGDVKRGLALMDRRGGPSWAYYWDVHGDVTLVERQLRDSDRRLRQLRGEIGARRAGR